MRVKGFIAILLIILSFGFVKAQTKTFEGIVKYDAKFVDEEAETNLTLTMDYYIKNNKFRVEFNSPEGQAIMLINKDKTVMLIPQNNMFMEFSNTEENETGEPNLKDDFTKAKTGETKEILGYMCAQYIFKEDDGTMELWFTKDLGYFIFAANPMEKAKIDDKYFEDGFFPLVIKMKDPSGTENGSLEAVKIEKKMLADEMFEIPAGYTKFTVPEMQFPTGNEDE
ncbi:MAG: DUF4412 domain-containing protein [bacterium]